MKCKRLIYFALALVLAILVLQVLPYWLGSEDFASLQNKSVPKFSRCTDPPADGGSIHYEGFGYTLWSLHRLTNFGMGKNGLIVGPKIEYWLPFGLTSDRTDTIILELSEESP